MGGTSRSVHWDYMSKHSEGNADHCHGDAEQQPAQLSSKQHMVHTSRYICWQLRNPASRPASRVAADCSRRVRKVTLDAIVSM